MSAPGDWKRRALWLAAGCMGALAVAYGVQRARPAAWESTQAVYRQHQLAAGQPPIDIGIRSLRPGEARSEERCVSCHLGMVLPDAYEPPFQRHPALDCLLTPANQGCVACHGGAPRALSASIAHGAERTGARALLSWSASKSGIRDIEAGCATCHVRRRGGVLRYDEQVVPEVGRGLALFVRQGCPSCHRVDGVGAWSEVGPALSTVGALRSKPWIMEQLRHPQRRAPSSPMPPLTVSDGDAERLTVFLLAQVGPEREPGTSGAEALLARQSTPSASAHFPEDLPTATTPAAGALWMHAVGCAGCHRLDERGDGVPDLRRVGWYSDADRNRKVLEDPQSVFPGTLMPKIDIPPYALDAMVANLTLQRTPLPSSQGAVLEELCRPCHGEARDAKAVMLVRRPPAFADVKSRLSEEEFASAVTEGREGTAMAPWGRVLSRTFILGLYQRLDAPKGAK